MKKFIIVIILLVILGLTGASVTATEPVFKTCGEGEYNIGTEEESICRDEPTGCPYGDSIPLDSAKCVSPVEEEPTEEVVPTPVEEPVYEQYSGK